MMGIGIGEMILIAGVALVVIGPDKFPDFAKIVLRTVRDLRGYVDEVKDELGKELKPLKKEIQDLSKYDPEKYIDGLTSSGSSSSSGGKSSSGSSGYEDSYTYGYEEGRDENTGTGETENAGTEEPQPGEEHAETGYPDDSGTDTSTDASTDTSTDAGSSHDTGDGVNDTFNIGPSEDGERYPD